MVSSMPAFIYAYIAATPAHYWMALPGQHTSLYSLANTRIIPGDRDVRTLPLVNS